MKEITLAFTCLACKACTHLHRVPAQVCHCRCKCRQVCVRQDLACEVQQDFVPQVQVRPPMQVTIYGSYFILGPIASRPAAR